MRIRDIQVDGFGVWSGLKLSELSDELNVFYGPNEAGKTTLMQFVRAMLYGFSPERRQRYLPPVRQGRPGGTLTAAVDGKRYSISRHADEPGELGDVALVSDGNDVSRDAAALTPLVGDVDEATFSNVFAFGLREIQELGTLSDTRAADELYELALGLDRVSLLDVMRELETSRTRLLAPDDRPSLVSQLLSQRERLQSEIDELAQGTARYLALSAERDKLNAEIARLEDEVARFERQGRELSLARSLSDRWQRRVAIDERLGKLSGYDSLPENALARFDQVDARLTNRRRRFETLRASRRELSAQIDALGINEALCRHAPRLEALAEQQQWIASLETEVDQLEVELLELESQHEEGLKQFGISSIVATGQGISRRGWSELRALAKRLHAARLDVSEAKE
ncbi:MAG: AAA family ATPase, partial [Pirellulales bacterium]